ncbi:STAS domain-containing protein [Nocardioides zhouii]|uniref:Anti-sigma factor antagonist n=1 Tax=Nocardioides zhouii TaxID=1168729 RepID=A0A4Q2SE16_9ACTN|nr:STAS domain-containing protein [Nocardioides zhouii]RYC03576.1 anti-sigma factor antagonist [Nocardioides zhouii]
MNAVQGEVLARPTSATWVVVVLSGELDFGSANALEVLNEAVREHPGAHVLVDLSNVTFVDSSVLVAFATARSRAEAAGGRLGLYAASAFTRRLLEIWHLEPVREDAAHGGDAA